MSMTSILLPRRKTCPASTRFATGHMTADRCRTAPTAGTAR
jgi:hypothetical protein